MNLSDNTLEGKLKEERQIEDKNKRDLVLNKNRNSKVILALRKVL